MRFALLLIFLSTGTAAAQDNHAAPTRPPLPVIECFCTDRAGQRVDLGQMICLIVDGRAYLARCEMSLNSPMWRDTGSDCVGAGLSVPTPGAG